MAGKSWKAGWVWLAVVSALVAGMVLGTGLSCAGAHLWYASGNLARAGRQSDLRILKTALVMRAKETGRYPADLDGVIQRLGMGRRVNAAQLAYPAAGREFEEEDDRIIFYELESRRYGPVVGYYICFPGDPQPEVFCLQSPW